MRHEIPKPPPRKGKEYRVMYEATEATCKLFGIPVDTPVTAFPGIISNNLPRATSVLQSLQKYRVCWIEVRETNPESEWKKL